MYIGRGDCQPWAVGVPLPPSLKKFFHAVLQLTECGRSRLGSLFFLGTSATSFIPFALLHARWESCRLDRSDGCPPLNTGMMWSIDADIGSGDFNDLSTGCPQIAHSSCVASMIFLLVSNCERCAPVRSGLYMVSTPICAPW